MLLLTRYVLFRYPFEDVDVEYGTEHPLEDPDLRSDTEREEHHEEDDRPERGCRQLDDGLGEHDERQAGSFGRLLELLLQ